jgi:hypothetical protein
MILRCLGTQVIAAPVLFMSLGAASNAQVLRGGQANSATHVEAEMTKGKLNPAESKAGDTVVLKLSDDLRSNGKVVLRQGTMITGVVRSVGRGEPKTHPQSMIEINWLIPPVEAKAAQSITIAVQSVIQLNAADRNEGEDPLPDNSETPAAHFAGIAAVPADPALLSMPSVVAVDYQTSSAIETSLDSSAPGPLFKVGHGELIASGGIRESVDLFSHLSNDTVITSPSKNFEISSDARMQLLVGIRK